MIRVRIVQCTSLKIEKRCHILVTVKHKQNYHNPSTCSLLLDALAKTGIFFKRTERQLRLQLVLCLTSWDRESSCVRKKRSRKFVAHAKNVFFCNVQCGRPVSSNPLSKKYEHPFVT